MILKYNKRKVFHQTESVLGQLLWPFHWNFYISMGYSYVTALLAITSQPGPKQ
jgi:hypothetical protein